MSSVTLPPFFAQHRRSLIIVAVLVVLLVVIIAKGHTTTPPASSTTTTTTTTTTTVPQGIGAVPNDAQILAVFNNMTSGSPAEARQATLHQLPVFPLTNNVALYRGYYDLGFKLDSTLPKRIHHSVTSTLIIENSSHYVLARAALTWVASNGQWHLLAWPHLVAP
jgi:hypothetical protein